jgi:predicted nucleic acid-binding protein
MGGLVYVVDTNLVSDFIKGRSSVVSKINQAKSDTLFLCQVVDYELRRGFLYKQANTQLQFYETKILPEFDWLELSDSDWLLAAQFWADTKRQGKQLSDIDLLLAAVSVRLNAILVSSDDDFDALPVKRENWREA